MTDTGEKSTRPQWAWALIIGGLALAGLLLSLADVALGPKWPQPLAASFTSTAPVKFDGLRPPYGTQPVKFEQKFPSQVYVVKAPIGFGGVPLNPLQALRVFLSNGAGLVLLALAALLIFPARARRSVEHLEGKHGIEIALVTGVAMFLLALAAGTLLRYTLVFLPVIPVLLLVVMAAALFGIACISLATGRFMHRKLKLASVHPLIAALAGALVVFDLAVIPYAGVFVLGAFAIGGLGLAVITRFGSSGGWSFRDLSW